MPSRFSASLRRFGYLLRLEVREARNIVGLVLGLSAMITLGVAWFASREQFVLAFEVSEALLLGAFAFAGSLAVLADVLAGSDERAGRRAMASLPVSSATAFASRVVVVVGAAALIYVVLCATWIASVLVAHWALETRSVSHGFKDLGGVVLELVHGGALVIPLGAAAATAFVALVFRHALAATVAGWAAIASLVAFQFDAGIIDLGTRHLFFPKLAADVASSPITPMALLLGMGASYQLRGAASRSWLARSWRIALVLGLSSVAAASALELRDWRRTSYEFLDPLAYVDGPFPLVTLDGQAAVFNLRKNGYSTGWRVDLATGSAERFEFGQADRIPSDPFNLLFERGMKRRRRSIVRDHVYIDDVWHSRVTEESLSSRHGGPMVTVQAKWIIPPRRRLPEVAFYLDAGDRLHRVDLSTGDDSATEYTLSGYPSGACIDEEGRWLTWISSDERFHAIDLESGEETIFPGEDPADLPENLPGDRPKIYGSPWMPSLGGKPILRCYEGDGWPSHATIEDGKVVGLPLARRYYQLVDVDGERLVGLSEENGLYLLGPDCQEIEVLREPMPDALPRKP